MSITAEISRDEAGFPSFVTVKDRNKKLTVTYDSEKGFSIKGSRASFTPELLNVLSMIYPVTQKVKVESITGIRQTPLHGRIVNLTTNFVERWEYLKDAVNRKSFFFNQYTGRSYPFSSVWKSEVGTDPTTWNLPLYVFDDAPVTEGAGWRNAIHMRNSKDGVTVDEIYVQPRMVIDPPAIMRITCKFPDPAGVPAGTALIFGFEVNSQGGNAICGLFIEDVGVNLRSTCMTPTARDVRATAITLTDPTGYHDFWLDYDPPNIRLWGWDGAATSILGSVTIGNSPDAFDCVSPFVTNESASVVSGFHVAHWAVWQRRKPTQAFNPAIYTKTMTNANAEYSQALPSGTKKFLIQCRDGTAFRLAFVTGKVATPIEPYVTIPANSTYSEDLVFSHDTLFFACASAGKVVEIIAWT